MTSKRIAIRVALSLIVAVLALAPSADAIMGGCECFDCRPTSLMNSECLAVQNNQTGYTLCAPTIIHDPYGYIFAFSCVVGGDYCECIWVRG